MTKFVNGKEITIPPEEEKEIKNFIEAELRAEEIKQRIEATRPLNVDEVVAKIIPSVINQAPIDDKTALRCKEFYPTFKWCCDNNIKAEEKGYKFTDNDRKQLFKTVQPNFKFTEIYPPTEGTESIYERIDEVHEGTKADPIPYEGNMTLIKGKFYTQNNILYECVRDSGIAVHQPLSELATVQGGKFVKEVS